MSIIGDENPGGNRAATDVGSVTTEDLARARDSSTDAGGAARTAGSTIIHQMLREDGNDDPIPEMLILSNDMYSIFERLQDVKLRIGTGKGSHLQPDEYLCCICKSPIADVQTALVHNLCSMQAHARCALQWLSENDTCPYCLRAMKSNETSVMGSGRASSTRASWVTSLDSRTSRGRAALVRASSRRSGVLSRRYSGSISGSSDSNTRSSIHGLADTSETHGSDEVRALKRLIAIQRLFERMSEDGEQQVLIAELVLQQAHMWLQSAQHQLDRAQEQRQGTW